MCQTSLHPEFLKMVSTGNMPIRYKSRDIAFNSLYCGGLNGKNFEVLHHLDLDLTIPNVVKEIILQYIEILGSQIIHFLSYFALQCFTTLAFFKCKRALKYICIDSICD